MATRTKRLATLAALEDRREQAAAGRLRRGRTEVDDHRTTLERLLQYKQDYLGRLESGEHDISNSNEIKNLHVFINSLDRAIQLVHDRIRAAAGECDRQLRDWMSTRSRARAVHTVLDRQRLAALRRESRHEQLEADDRNGSAARPPQK